MKPPVLLRIYKNDQLESVKQFDQEQIVFGRNADVQVDLQDESVSPLHAIIEDRQSGYYISDLGSRTGTILRGQRVLDEPLQSGDELRMGAYRIEFFIGVPKPVAPPRAEPPAPPQVEVPRVPQQAEPPVPEQAEPPVPPAPAKPAVAPAAPAVPVVTMTKESPASVSGTPTGGVALAAKTWTKKKKRGKTFAPPSQIRDLSEVLKPQKGPLLEVLVVWKDRVLSTQHFKDRGVIRIGAGAHAEVQVPGLKSNGAGFPLIRLEGNALISLTTGIQGQLWLDSVKSLALSDPSLASRFRGQGGLRELELRQGEMLRLDLPGEMISLFIRYSAATPKALVAPLIDLSSSELTGVALAFLVALILGLYIQVYEPAPLDDGSLIEEPLRKATVTFQPPRPKPKPPPQVVPVAEEKREVREKKVVQITEQKPKAQQRPQITQPKDPGKAAEVKPAARPAPKDTKVSARPKGGSVKTGEQEGASAKSQRPDPSKMGLLGAFGGGGTRERLDRAFEGSGELTGLADRATGRTGQAEDRAGDGIGGRLRDTGGGKGAATEGLSGVGTKGRGSGSFGYGTGGALGQRGTVNINVEGVEAEFSPTIDREAIRRVILNNRSAIRSCYETQLNRNPNLYGKVVLEWDIDERGRVIRAVINSNDMGTNSVAECVIRLLRTWRFPEMPPDQIGRVLFPFVFTSQ